MRGAWWLKDRIENWQTTISAERETLHLRRQSVFGRLYGIWRSRTGWQHSHLREAGHAFLLHLCLLERERLMTHVKPACQASEDSIVSPEKRGRASRCMCELKKIPAFREFNIGISQQCRPHEYAWRKFPSTLLSWLERLKCQEPCDNMGEGGL